MKTIYMFFILIVSISTTSCVSSKPDSSSNQLKQTAKSYKIGHINVVQLLKNSNEGQRAKSLSDKKVEEYKIIIHKRLSELQGQRTNEIDELVANSKLEIKKFQDDLLEPLLKKCEQAVSLYSIENKFDIIFDGKEMKNDEIVWVYFNKNKFTKTEASLILNKSVKSFAQLKTETEDISEAIIEILNNG